MNQKFNNVDNLFLEDPVEIIFDIVLIFPYSSSLETLLKMISTWSMRLISGNTQSPKAAIAIKYEKFLKLFGAKEKIVIGNEYKLKGTETFISKMKLKEIKGNRK